MASCGLSYNWTFFRVSNIFAICTFCIQLFLSDYFQMEHPVVGNTVSCSLIFLEVILLLFQINQTGLIAYVQENTFSEPTDLQKWMKKKENEYHQSKERIARICSKWERKPLNETSFVKRLLFVDKYKVVLCKNDKVRKAVLPTLRLFIQIYSKQKKMLF